MLILFIELTFIATFYLWQIIWFFPIKELLKVYFLKNILLDSFFYLNKLEICVYRETQDDSKWW